VMPGFFETIGATIVMGRPLTEDDTTSTLNVAVVNEAFAKRFFKSQNPIGQHFGFDRIKFASTYEIVGVVNDIRYMTYDYKDPVRPMVSMFTVANVRNPMNCVRPCHPPYSAARREGRRVS
jgi:putative ABC transport system permease protein